MNFKDKRGKTIRVFDVLKVFHFVGARRKKHYMYKQVVSVNGELYAKHLMPVKKGNADGFFLKSVGGADGLLIDFEIVQSYEAKEAGQ